DVVVVVDPAEVGELQVASERSGFRRDTFHHAAVAAQCINVEVNEILKSRLVEVSGRPAASNGHPDAGGDTVSQRSSGGLNTARPTIFRVARAPAVELPESFDCI